LTLTSLAISSRAQLGVRFAARMGMRVALVLVACAVLVVLHTGWTYFMQGASPAGDIRAGGEAGSQYLAWRLPFVLFTLVSAPMLAAPYLLVVRGTGASRPDRGPDTMAEGTANGFVLGGSFAISFYYLAVVIGIAWLAWSGISELSAIEFGSRAQAIGFYAVLAAPVIFVIGVLCAHVACLVLGLILGRINRAPPVRG
jgi:hypothetical protein